MTQRQLKPNTIKNHKSIKKSSQTDFDYTLKLIIIGDSGVGKSSILTRFNQNKFFENHIATIGLNHAAKTLTIEGLKIKLNIWDTAGQDKFRNLTRSYYRNAQGAMVAFSINSQQSYCSVRNWIQQFAQNTEDNVPFLLVGTKKDLEANREIDKEEAQQYAKNHGIQYFQCSAKNGEGIQEAFFQLGRLMKMNSIDKKLKEEKHGFKIKDPQKAKGFRDKCCQN